MSEEKNNELCEDCLKLVGAPKYASPHANLVRTRHTPISSIMGAADEIYYTCKVCGHEWLHETGSAGFGWVE